MQMEESFEICKQLKEREGVVFFHPMHNLQETLPDLPAEEWFVVAHLSNGEPRTISTQQDFEELIRYLEMPRLEWDEVSRIVEAIEKDPVVGKIIIQSDPFFGWEIAVQTQTGGGVKVRSLDGWERWKSR